LPPNIPEKTNDEEKIQSQNIVFNTSFQIELEICSIEPTSAKNITFSYNLSFTEGESEVPNVQIMKDISKGFYF
jgi:hypothetical protein